MVAFRLPFNLIRMACMAAQVTHHYPLQWFTRSEGEDVCLLILNSRFYGLESVIRKYFNKFSACACADGGSNSLFGVMKEQDREKFIPNWICGDLDSARAEVLKFYQEKGTTIVKLEDQDHTDFSKTLQHLYSQDQKFSRVYALNALWGRFDQTLASVSTLYSQAKQHAGSTELYLMSEDSLLFLLQPGEHVIHVDSGLEEGHCGLVPLGEPCEHCTTTGLQWNLAGDGMKLGGLISTSNLLVQGTSAVKVQTTNTLLWTMSHNLLAHCTSY